MSTVLTKSIGLVACLASSGCMSMLQPSASYEANPQLLALAPAVVFQGSGGPLSYQAPVGKDGQRYGPIQRIRGRACQRGIQVPILAILTGLGASKKHGGPGALSVGWGDGTFQAAIDDARRQLPDGAILYDVLADLNHRSFLSVYREQCVRIDAGVLVPVSSSAPASAEAGGT